VKAAVLGAGGTIAPAIVRDLANSDEVESLLLLDLDADRAEEVAGRYGGGMAVARRVDATIGLAAALEGCDVLVNSASYRINLDAMHACLQARCHYLDLGGLYWVAARQLELSDQFARADLIAILGIGSSPGKTNLMAAQAARALEEVEEIHVSAAGQDLDPPLGFSVPYALRTLLDELTLRPIVVRDGEPVEVDPLADGGEVDFGDPLGVRSTIYTLHSEMLSFPSSFGCREGSFRLSLAPELLDRLRELVGASDREIEEAAAAAARPSSQTVSVHMVEASGEGREVRARAVTHPHEGWGLGGGIVSTAAPAAAALRLLARGAIDARGALPPERCIDPEEMFPELERRGTVFELAISEGAAR
jgi:saccharopine dehydrogenase (NAD+, L-lysine-forming)